MTKTKKVTQDQVYKRSLTQEKLFSNHATFLLYKIGNMPDDFTAKIFIKYPTDGAGRVQGFMRISCASPGLLPREELKDPKYEGEKSWILSASCNGYGYCKTSTILSSLFEQVQFSNVVGKWNASVSGAGVSSVERQLREHHGYFLVRV